jgi:8-oxo-dGTP diphosphatase
MTIRLSAGVIVLDPDDRVALVRHSKPGVYDFWVAPGGGVEPGEDLRAAALREAFEEAGLTIVSSMLIAIEQLHGKQTGHQVKHWFFARHATAPPLQADKPSSSRELIVEARWFARSELVGKEVYPPLLAGAFWEDLAVGFPMVRILDLRVLANE